MSKIMILEDDATQRRTFAELLRLEGYRVETATGSDDFFDIYPRFKPELLLVDIELANSPMDGLQILQKIKELDAHPPQAIIISGRDNKENLGLALELGAYNFISKHSNTNLERLLLDIKHAILLRQRELERSHLLDTQEELRRQYAIKSLLMGTSQVMQQVRATLQQAATSQQDLLITGPTGSGKTQAANYCYAHSLRFGLPFLKFRMSLPSERQSLLDLTNPKNPLLARAVGFDADKRIFVYIDELDVLLPEEQAALIRLLDISREQLDVQFMFSSTKNLRKQTTGVKQELIYRLSALDVKLPPLVEREQDLFLLLQHFLTEFTEPTKGKPMLKMSLLRVPMLRYDWPGNVRELRNFCQRVSLFNKQIDTKAVLNCLQNKDQPVTGANEDLQRLLRLTPHKQAMREFEQIYIGHHLKLNNNKRQQTANKLGIDRTTLYLKIKDLPSQK